MKKVDRTNIGEHLVDYELTMIGKTMAEAYKNEKWFHEWTMNDEQFNQLKAYALPLIRKTFKCNRTKAEEIFNWWNLGFGLRIDNTKSNNNEDLEDLKL